MIEKSAYLQHTANMCLKIPILGIKEHLQIDKKMTNKSIEKQAKDMERQFTKETYKWSINLLKVIQTHP